MSARERWNGFLAQIEARHAEIAKDAFEGAKEALPALGFDTTPVAVALGAVRHRLQELESRIEDTWSEKVEPVFEAEGVSRAEIDHARSQGRALRRRLERQRERIEPHAFAYAAQVMHQRALAERRDLACARCGAPLSPPVTYRAIEVRCGACSAVGVFEPGSLLRQVEAVGSHAVAWVHAEQEWFAMCAAEDAVRDARSPVPLALLQAYEAAQINYWTRYFQVQSAISPEVDPVRGMRSRLEFWYSMSAEHEPTWRDAGRPRRVPPP